MKTMMPGICASLRRRRWITSAADVSGRSAKGLRPKVILPEFAANPVARERFLREARACAALKSDHVVTIYQVGQDRDIPYLAMEFLEGESLESRLEKGSRFSWTEICRIGREAANNHKPVNHRDADEFARRAAVPGPVRITTADLTRSAARHR